MPPMTSRPGPIAGADVHMQGMGVVQSPPVHALGYRGHASQFEPAGLHIGEPMLRSSRDVHYPGPEEVPANVKIAELERQLAAMREREQGSLARQQQHQMPVRPAVPDPHLVAPWQPNPLQQLAKAGPWQNEHQARADETLGVAGKTAQAGIQRAEAQSDGRTCSRGCPG